MSGDSWDQGGYVKGVDMKVFICDNGWKGAYIVKAESKDEAIAKIAKFLHSDITGAEMTTVSEGIYEMIEDVIETKGDM